MDKTQVSIFTRFSEAVCLSLMGIIFLIPCMQTLVQLNTTPTQVGTLFALNAGLAQDPAAPLTQIEAQTATGTPCTLNLVPRPDQHTSFMILGMNPEGAVFQLTSNTPVGTCGQDGLVRVLPDRLIPFLSHMAAGHRDDPMPSVPPPTLAYAQVM